MAMIIDSEARARPSRARRCLALLVVLGFALGCSEFVVIGIEPQIADAFHIPLARAGELISGFAVTYAVATPVLTLLTGRFRRYPLLVAYAAIFVASGLLAMVAPTFELLVLARVMLGAVSGMLLALGVTFIPELVPVSRVSPMISVVYAAFSVAMVISTSVGKMIADASSWRVTMSASFVLVAVVCVALVGIMPRAGATDERATAGDQLRLLRDSRVLSGMAIFIFGVGSIYVFYAYVTPYLEDVLGMPPLAASWALMAYGCACIASNLISGWVDARFGMRTLIFSFLLQAGLLAALFAVGSAMPGALAIILAIALTMYVASVPCASMFMRVARTEHPRALTLAASLEPVSFNIGMALGTVAGGAIVSGPGMGCVGVVGAALSLLACALAVWTTHLLGCERARAA